MGRMVGSRSGEEACSEREGWVEYSKLFDCRMSIAFTADRLALEPDIRSGRKKNEKSRVVSQSLTVSERFILQFSIRMVVTI